MSPWSPLARARVLTLSGVLLLCLDSPIYRLLRLSVAPSDPLFGFAACVWRAAFSGATFALAAAWLDGFSAARLSAHCAALGARTLIGAALLLA